MSKSKDLFNLSISADDLTPLPGQTTIDDFLAEMKDGKNATK